MSVVVFLCGSEIFSKRAMDIEDGEKCKGARRIRKHWS